MARPPSLMNRQEADRRQSRTDRIEDLFRSRPGEWIGVPDLADAGGFCAWRTRVSDLRKRLVRAGLGDIEWNRRVRESAYRWVQRRRDETAPTRLASQATLF